MLKNTTERLLFQKNAVVLDLHSFEKQAFGGCFSALVRRPEKCIKVPENHVERS
jgi:hypothetical protein